MTVNTITTNDDGNMSKSKTNTPSTLLDTNNVNNMNQCRILCISDPNDMNNMILYDPNQLPEGCQLLHSIAANDRNDLESLLEIILEDRINTIFVSDPTSRWMLAYILSGLSKSVSQHQSSRHHHPIVWIHARSAGIDSIISPELLQWYTDGTRTTSAEDSNSHTCSYGTVQMTNARGLFSSTLAEYSIGACTYFSKDFHRLKQNQKKRVWEKYVITMITPCLFCFRQNQIINVT
jgi:hypothetical protein